ncbi:hypothetical protein [Cerasicoccus frondis]|uniref:hypothetical protein n=1 Tax=Cerasicoccus frondis TaxID=490090 RepID=UPI002852AD60|nr:hypothetical protein [Cerasicoccus frondis]
MEVKVSVQDNPVKPGSKRLILHTGERVGFAEFQQYCRERGGVSETQAGAVVELMQEWLALNATKGREVDFGPLGRTRLGMKGSFDDTPGRILDKQVKLTISWILPRKLQARIAQAGEKLVRRRVNANSKAPIVQQVKALDEKGQELTEPNVYVAGGFVRIRGAQLNYDPAGEDEGVFLIRPRKAAVQLTTVVPISRHELLARIPDDFTGAAKLRVIRRHPAKTGTLLEGDIAVEEAG